jgi:hypothetical protein
LLPTCISAPERSISRWLQEHGATTVVVRPDAIVLGVATTTPDLHAVFAQLLTHLQ